MKIVDLVFEAATKVDRLNDDFVVEASISLSRIQKCQLAMAVILSLAVCAELLALPLLFPNLSQPQIVQPNLQKDLFFPLPKMALIWTNGSVFEASLQATGAIEIQHKFNLPTKSSYHSYSDEKGGLYFINAIAEKRSYKYIKGKQSILLAKIFQKHLKFMSASRIGWNLWIHEPQINNQWEGQGDHQINENTQVWNIKKEKHLLGPSYVDIMPNINADNSFKLCSMPVNSSHVFITNYLPESAPSVHEIAPAALLPFKGRFDLIF